GRSRSPARGRTPERRNLPAGRRDPRGAHGARGRSVLRSGVRPGPRPDAARAVGVQVRARGAVLYAPQDGPPLLYVLVRRAAAARRRGARGAAAALFREAHAPGRGRELTCLSPPGSGGTCIRAW